MGGARRDAGAARRGQGASRAGQGPGGEGEGLGDPSRLDATSSPAYVATHYESAASVVRWRERTSSSKRVFGWTANTDAITRTLLDAAVDGLVTNFPVKVRSQVEREQNLCQDT